MKGVIINTSYEAMSEAVAQMDEQLKCWKVSNEERIKSILTLEEILVKVVNAAHEGEKISLQLRRSYRQVAFHISCRGSRIEIANETMDEDSVCDEFGPEAEELIRNMILSHSQEALTVRYEQGINKIELLVHKNEKAGIYDTLIAIALGVVSAVGLRMALPAETVMAVEENFFGPIFTVFMRLVMMILAPMIFFSLASCIANITDLSALGRASVKILGSYFATTLLAITVAIGMYQLMQPAAGAAITLPAASEKVGDLAETSLLQTIIQIVPNNFLGAFVLSDVLQVLFLAIVVGIAVGAAGAYGAAIRQGMEAINALTQSILSYIVKLMPIAIFGAVGQMVCTLDLAAFGLLGKYLLVILLSYLVMQVVYAAYIGIMGRVNPLIFLRRFLRVQLTALSTGSSCATMPVTMQAVRDLGVSPRIYNFSIPLGTTINMDGASISFVISGLFLASLYGIQIDAGTMASFILTVVLISMATPPVSGAGIAMQLVVLNSLHVPLEAVTILVGIMPLIEIADTVNNVVGDGSVTLVVARSEGLMDEEQYYKDMAS